MVFSSSILLISIGFIKEIQNIELFPWITNIGIMLIGVFLLVVEIGLIGLDSIYTESENGR